MRGRGPSGAMVGALAALREDGIVEELKTMGPTPRARAAFDRFAAATHGDWTRMARELHRRWEIPAAVEIEDVLAELLAAAWRALPAWDSSLRALPDYLCWNAYAGARKWINSQRDAYRRDGKARSRHPIADSRLGTRQDDDTDRRRSVVDREDSLWAEPPVSPEERIDAARLGAELVERLSADEVQAFVFLIQETADQETEDSARVSPELRAARRLPGDTRLRNGLGSERKARTFVGASLRRAVEIVRTIEHAADAAA